MPWTGSLQATSARVAAGLVAAALAAGGCAPQPRQRARPSLSPRPPTSPSLPHPTAGPSAPGTARAAPSPTRPPSPKPIPADPAAAVGALLRAIVEEDYLQQRAATAQAARVLFAIRDIVHQENERRGATTRNEVDVQDPPRTLEVTGDVARVALRAINRAEVSGPKGRLPEETVLGGPVVLQRLDGAWRVTDLVYGDAPLSSGYYPVDTRTTAHGFTLVVGALLTYKGTTAAVIRLVGPQDRRTPLVVKKAELTAPDGSVRPWVQFAFESQVTPAGFLGFERVEGKPRALRLEVERADTHETWTYEVAF